MVIDELLDALFFRKIDELTNKYKELEALYYPHDPESYDKAFKQYIRQAIGTKENLCAIVEDYHQHGKPIWQQQANQWCDPLNSEKLNSVFRNGGEQVGRERVEMIKEMKKKWAFHLDEYAAWVNTEDHLNILELATGAGMGTWAIMNTLKENSRMISIDVDFGCVKNADGIARYLGCEHKVVGLNANFWNLPYENELLDVVCTHYGIDESGEVQKTLSEVARVLKPNGRFIGVARKRPYDRQQKYFKMFDVNEEEGTTLLHQLRLYSGLENLEKIAHIYGLRLEKCKEFKPETGHGRVLFCFIKAV